jgi:lipoprotein-anchoring transpeptidase ErfK/SrfK
MNVLKKTVLIGIFSTPLFAYQEIIIDLSEQMAYAMEDGYIIFEGRISSGKRGRETPTGEFKVIGKERYHRSNLWPKPNGGARMNYMLRLTNSGIAMHLGHVPNKPASHGCVRMKNGFAQKMFRWAKVGTEVYIEGSGDEYLEYVNGYKNSYYNDGYRID